MPGHSYTKYEYFVYELWIGNFPNPNFVFPIFPIFPGKYKKQVYKSGYEFVKQNISQVFISERLNGCKMRGNVTLAFSHLLIIVIVY